MIISENSKPSVVEFKSLMEKTDEYLNRDAKNREAYYIGRSGKKLEYDVYEVLKECAKGTRFADSIELVSGASFPDIVANKYYGVEVKSTEKNHWTTIGSSILESTRIPDVERIFLTFGKLGKPVEFLSRPYEQCLSDIAVTHYPRYKIDMRLAPGQTIFDKMGVGYDTLRKMDNPVAPVSEYYRSKLQPGESLWWAGNDAEAATSPATIKLWSSLTAEEKNNILVQGLILFPELLGPSSPTKYNRYTLWLASYCGIIANNARDAFSAGGKINFILNGNTIKLPAVFGRIIRNRALLESTLNDVPEELLKEYWNSKSINDNRMKQWCLLAIESSRKVVDGENCRDVLNTIFPF